MGTQDFQFTDAARKGISLPATPIKRIVYTGEIFQPGLDGRPTLAGEVRWFSNLLGYSVSQACPGIPQEAVAWEAAGGGAFDGDKFYELQGSSPNVDNWSTLVDAPSLTGPAADYLKQTFDGAFVVGYGMSNVMLKFMNEAGIPYLDFVLHAARFCDDIFYGVRTNVQQSYDALTTFRYPEEMIYLQANIHRASMLRYPPLNIAPDSGLFAAQFGIDKALVAQGRFTRLEDYREQIEGFLSRHQYIYLKPHPYAREGGRLIAFLRAMAGDSDRIRLIRDNAYMLLSQRNLTEVCGISSSVLYEAEYFGMRAIHMSPNRMDFSEKETQFDPWRFVPIYDEFFSPHFWARVLDGVSKISATAPNLQLPRKTSRLRNNLHIYWGYSFLDWEVPLRGMNIHPPQTPIDMTPPRDSHAEGGRLMRKGQFEEAASCFADAVAKEESAQRWNDWASARLAAGRTQEAIDGFKMALRLDPGNAAATTQLAKLSR